MVVALMQAADTSTARPMITTAMAGHRLAVGAHPMVAEVDHGGPDTLRQHRHPPRDLATKDGKRYSRLNMPVAVANASLEKVDKE